MLKKFHLPIVVALLLGGLILPGYYIEKPIAVSSADLGEVNKLHFSRLLSIQPSERALGVSCYDNQGNIVAQGSRCINGSSVCVPNDCPPGSSPNRPKY